MHWKMSASWCLCANHPVTTLLVFESTFPAEEGYRIQLILHSHSAAHADIAPVPPLPMLLLKVQQSQMGVTPLNTVQGTDFANSSVNTAESVGLQKSRF